MKKILLLLAVILCSAACKEEKKAPENTTLMNRVMAIHDEVMPKMSTVGKLIEELNRKATTAEKAPRHKAAIQDLQAANTAMMEWMENFSDRFDSEEILNSKTLTARKQAWLREEEEKVKILREQIHTSIKNAEALLNKE